MIEVESKLRRWGRSIGLVVPKKIVETEKLKEGDSVKLVLAKKSNVLKEVFGTLRFKRSTDEILSESDKEAWDE